MRCRRVKRLLITRETDPLPAVVAHALAQHLESCRECAAAARVDACVVAGLSSLRGQIPYEIDVRSRVALAVEQCPPATRHEVPTWQLAGAAAVALAGVGLLLGSLWAFWPGWSNGFASLSALVGGVVDLAASAGAALLTVIGLLLDLLSVGSGLARGFVEVLARLEPVAIVAVSLCYLVMGASILHVIGRDFRNPAKPRTREE